MSISTKSYESLIKLATAFYDPHIPLYYTPEHIDMVSDIILLLLQRKTIKLVTTTEILVEPIVEHKHIIYISIPLVARLINEPVELPKNTVDFIDGSKFDIFNNLDYGITNADSKNRFSLCNQENDPDHHYIEDFTPHERIRFTQMLRIVFMCSHFYQHYIDKIPYSRHLQSTNHVEFAVQSKKLHSTIQETIEPTINYDLVVNM